MDNLIKVYTYIPAKKAEKIANNEEFRVLDYKSNLKFIGLTDFNHEICEVYFSFETGKYYIVNPE